MPVFLSLRTVGSFTILELGEHLKAEHVSEFRDMFQYLAEQGQIHVLLDGSRLRIVDSLGIGSLVGNWVSLKKRGGKWEVGITKPFEPTARCPTTCRHARSYRSVRLYRQGATN